MITASRPKHLYPMRHRQTHKQKRLASAWKGLSFIADLLDNDLCAKNFGADA